MPSLTDILPAVQTQIATVTTLPFTAIRLIGRRQPTHFISDQEVLLRPGDVQFDVGIDHGAGRVCAIIHRPLLVYVRTRCNLDPSDSDEAKLTDSALGHIPLEESVCNALLDFCPLDGSGNMLTVEPMHPMAFPEEEVGEAQSADWIETRLAFLLSYQLTLSPNHS